MYESAFTATDSSTVLRAAWRYRRPVALAIFLGFMLGLTYGLSRDPEVSASTTVVLRDASSVDLSLAESTENGAFARFVQSQAIFVTSDDVLSRVGQSLGASVDDVRDAVGARHTSSGDSMVMTATGVDEAEAKRLLAQLLQSYREVRLERVAAEADAVAALLRELSANAPDATQSEIDRAAVDLLVAQEVYGDGVSFVDHTDIDASGPILRVGLPAVGLAFFAAAVAFVLAALVDDRNPLIQGVSSVLDRHELPIRGAIPEKVVDQPVAYQRAAAEIERDLIHTEGGFAPMVLWVGVDIERDDAVTTISETARALADSGLKVCIVDGASEADPETQISYTTDPFTQASAVHATAFEAPSGGEVIIIRPAIAKRALPDYSRDEEFARYLQALTARFDLVIADCPPIEESPGAMRIARHCKAALVTVPRGARVLAVDDTVHSIRQASLPIEGFVVTDEPSRIGNSHWWSK